MNFQFFVHSSCALAVCVIAAGCSMVDPSQIEKTTHEDVYRPQKVNNPPWMQDNGTIFSGENSLLDNLRSDNDGNQLPVNKYLWRGSLDTLSFLPIASIDTFSGVISTDWTTAPGAPNERSRVTVYVREAELSATALDVSTFRETLSPGGTWQSVPSNPAVASQLEDAILTRARQLRIEDVDG